MSRFQYLRHSITLNLTRKGLLATILLSTLLLTAGYLFGKLWLEVPVVFLIGILWIVCVLRDIRWVVSVLFLVLMSAAAIGSILGLSPILMLAAGCANVLAWDLHRFEARLLDTDDPDTREIEKKHLQRVFMVLAASFVLIIVDSWLHIRFQFVILVFVTILAILILNQIILTIRKAGQPPRSKE